MIKDLLKEMFILKEKGYYKQAIEILYKMLELVDTPEETAEIIYELAEVYFFSGNLERAEHYVDKILEIVPEHYNALKLRIKLLSNDPIARVNIAQKLYKITDKPEDLKLYLALLNKAGRYKETITYAETSRRSFCCQEIAEAYFSLGEYHMAKAVLDEQTVLSENSELLLAKICYAINDEGALKTLENRLSKSLNPEVIRFIIKLEYEQMNYSKVIELAKFVSTTAPPETFYTLGLSCLLKKQSLNAKKYFNILCEREHNPMYNFALALAYIQANQTTQAIEVIKDNQQYLKLITIILNEKSISTNVLTKEFIALMEILNRDEAALFEVIEICFKRGSLTLIKDILKLRSNSRNLKYKFYEIKLYIKEKKYDKAEKLINNYRRNDAFAMLYAELLDAQNNFADLEVLLAQRKSYEQNEFEQCCYYYARIFESKGEYERAIDIAQKGLDFVNNYAEMYYTLLYGLYKHIGETRTSIECLEKAAKYNPELRPKLIREATEISI